jgi:hypothetical protein
VSRAIDHYNLDAILAVGYRVPSVDVARANELRQAILANEFCERPRAGGHA